MSPEEIAGIIKSTDRYNFHSHSQFCDGKATVSEIAAAASDKGFEVWGVSPHSPICISSPCNMTREDVPAYLDEMSRLQEVYAGRMRVLTSMEVDFLGRDFGPHIDYFQKLPLDYRIGSIHFVPNQDGIPLDCDGSAERFAGYLKAGYAGDLRYVVEKYFEQVLTMLELGGFEILGHFDKIIGNACTLDATLEDRAWYKALVLDVISHAKDAGVIVEINTKAIESRGRFYPAQRWWSLLKEADMTAAVNSDCHHPDLTDLGRAAALDLLKQQPTQQA